MSSSRYVQLALSILRRPVGRAGLAVAVLAGVMAPTVLFFEADHMPRGAFVTREPRGIYCLFSDDVAYVGGSRNWERTVANLFEPHNTHIVPAWRLVTWALVAWAGKLERVPVVLAIACYSILVSVMLLTGRLIARETGRASIGLAALVMIGTTSLMLAPVTWYSASQPLWAGAAILTGLWYAQQYRRDGRLPALFFAALSAPIAGWFWTIGHLAGPTAAAYLAADGRRRCRIAAAVPLAASFAAVALSLALGGRHIDGAISFHGRTVRQAASPLRGLAHTSQSIPENLVLGNLGLAAPTTPAQGAVLTVVLLGLWTAARVRRRVVDKGAAGRARVLEPLESAGLFLVLGGYLGVWTFRGYLDYLYLRTFDMRNIVPWYDAIPQIGAVLFISGWWSAGRTSSKPAPGAPGAELTIAGALAVGLLALALIVLNRPRVDALVRATTPSLLPSEQDNFRITRLQTIRANAVLWNRAEWQRAYLRRLDRVQAVARQMGIGIEDIRAAFGHRRIPAAFGPIGPARPDIYDAAALLDLPRRGKPVSPLIVRAALADYFTEEPEPRPGWIHANEPWPPDDDGR